MERKSEETGQGEGGEGDRQPWRARLAADLRAFKAEQDEVYGGIDAMTRARYQAGDLPREERAKVEQAMSDHPALRECMDVVREVFGVPIEVAKTERPPEKPWADRADPPRGDPENHR